MKKLTWRQGLTILFTLAVIVVNALANILPFNGLETGEISDRFAVYFVPAGYVFSIWGLIYLGMLAYTVYQALPASRDNPVLKRIAPLYWISGVANMLWLVFWHYEVFSLTIFAMLSILVPLILIHRQLSPVRAGMGARGRWMVAIPFSVYLGWISVATIANFSQLLFWLGWGGWGLDPAIWGVIMLAVATALGFAMRWRENDMAYGLVLVWAFAGIGVSQAGTPLVAIAAWTASGLVALAQLLPRPLGKAASEV